MILLHRATARLMPLDATVMYARRAHASSSGGATAVSGAARRERARRRDERVGQLCSTETTQREKHGKRDLPTWAGETEAIHGGGAHRTCGVGYSKGLKRGEREMHHGGGAHLLAQFEVSFVFTHVLGGAGVCDEFD